MQTYDVIIIGAGGAGLMCGIQSAKRGRKTLILDHATKIAEKIRISGGGRCNFTNINAAPDKYISSNPHFCRSALRRYTQHDFIEMVEAHKIAYHEKTLGQLFCDKSATDIIDMLLGQMNEAGAILKTGTTIDKVDVDEAGVFTCHTSNGVFTAASLVVATGGLSIPKIGATPYGFELAKQFGHTIIPPRAGLVPLTFDPAILNDTKDLSGLSVNPARVTSQSGMSFDEAILFTHRGISGPAILQISSYWQTGESITINLKPDMDVFAWLKSERGTQGKRQLSTILEGIVPQKLAQKISAQMGLQTRLADAPDSLLKQLAARIHNWQVKPSGSEGYRTAEVTLGGVNTDEISSKTFESQKQTGLYFIGEVMDVTGHLGGYNFQWAWSSGWCAGQYV